LKRIILFTLILTFVFALCACKGATGKAPATPDEPVVPDTPAPPDTPTPPDVPDVPDTPSTPDFPTTPEIPLAPAYPDISSFSRENPTIVYTSKDVSLIDPATGNTFTVPENHTLLSLGTVEIYTVILQEDTLFLSPTKSLTATRPAICESMESSFGGTYYPGSDKIVVIDAGHQAKGMYDTEPVGPGSSTFKAKVASGTEGVFTKIPEHELNLAVSLLLRDQLISRGYTVVMVRETPNIEISNSERAILANNYKADAFIRVHANGDTNPQKRGAIAIFQTQENPWCGNLYSSSRNLSETVLAAYCLQTGIENDGNWETDTMTGINWCSVPATIIELGYMSNAEEDKLMSTHQFRENAALGIAKGVDLYF